MEVIRILLTEYVYSLNLEDWRQLMFMRKELYVLIKKELKFGFNNIDSNAFAAIQTCGEHALYHQLDMRVARVIFRHVGYNPELKLVYPACQNIYYYTPLLCAIRGTDIFNQPLQMNYFKQLIAIGPCIFEEPTKLMNSVFATSNENVIMLVHTMLMSNEKHRWREFASIVYAAKCGIKFVDLLVANGIDINSTDSKGGNALFPLLRCGFYNAFKALVQRGANLTKKDNNGDDLVDYLCKEFYTYMNRDSINKKDLKDELTSLVHSAVVLQMFDEFRDDVRLAILRSSINNIIDTIWAGQYGGQ